MKKYHRPCGSDKLDLRSYRRALVPFCTHCGRFVEMSEVQTTDRRLSAIMYKGKAFIYGREVR